MFEIYESEGGWRISANCEDIMGDSDSFATVCGVYETKVEAAQALLKAAAETVIHVLSEAD